MWFAGDLKREKSHHEMTILLLNRNSTVVFYLIEAVGKCRFRRNRKQRLDLVLKILKPLLANKFGGWVGLRFFFHL